MKNKENEAEKELGKRKDIKNKEHELNNVEDSNWNIHFQKKINWKNTHLRSLINFTHGNALPQGICIYIWKIILYPKVM